MPESKRIKAVPLLILLAATIYLFFISGCQQDGGGKYSYIVKPVDFDNFADAVAEIGLYWVLMNKAPF